MAQPDRYETRKAVPAARAVIRLGAPLPPRQTSFLPDIFVNRNILPGLALLALVGVGTVLARYGAEKAEEVRINAWNEDIANVLLDQSNLKGGQRFYPKVEITGAGKTMEEKMQMEANKEPINVRKGPGSRDILGSVSVGNNAYNVVVQGSWAGTFCGNIENFVAKDASSIRVDQICAVDYTYTKASK